MNASQPFVSLAATQASVNPTATSAREAERHYEISTQHISPTTARWLREQGIIAANYSGPHSPMPVISLGATPYGWFMYVPEHFGERHRDIPDDLKNVLTFVRKLGIPYIYMDQDADTVDELPLFDW